MQGAMDFLRQLPDWLGTALVGALGGAVGWFANLIVSNRRRVTELKSGRRGRLIELQSLLHQTHSSFDNQAKLRDELLRKLEDRNPRDRIKLKQGNLSGEGYESYFLRMAPQFTQDERGLHAIIRSITISSLRPGNQALLNWIVRDDYFKLEHEDEPALKGLAHCIEQLQAHLWIWIAKYDAWIETNPDHALVYLDDEEQHGKRFPSEIEVCVDVAVRTF